MPTHDDRGAYRPVIPPAALARLAVPLDVAALALLLVAAPLSWEPIARWPVQAALALGALAGCYLAGGYRAARPIRRAAALRAALGFAAGLMLAWLALKLVAAKLGVFAATPPGLEGVVLGGALAALVVGALRVAWLTRLQRKERAARVL